MKSVRATVAVSLLKLCALLPLPLLHWLGDRLGALLYRLPGSFRDITRINLAHCLPELSVTEREQLVRRSLQESMKAALEAGPVWLWPLERAQACIRRVTGAELLQQAASEGRGVIVLTPHLGNWEMVNLYLSQHYPVSGMYLPQKIPQLDQVVYRARARTGVHLIPADPKGVIKIRKALTAGDLLLILPDQAPKRGYGVYVPFFGQTALTMRLVYALLQKTGARVVCMYGKRLPNGAGFEVVCRQPDAAIYDGELEVSAEAMNRSMEACIRDIPAQYHWEYKRFNKQADGSRLYQKV